MSGSEHTEHSPAGFSAPDPELDNGLVVCAGCGEESPADEMGVTADDKIETESGAVVQITRLYLHDDEKCMARFLGTDSDRSSNASTGESHD